MEEFIAEAARRGVFAYVNRRRAQHAFAKRAITERANGVLMTLDSSPQSTREPASTRDIRARASGRAVARRAGGDT